MVRAEHRGPDHSGFLAELRGDDLDRGPVLGAFDVPVEPFAQWIEEHTAELDQTARDQDDRRIEDVGQPDQPDRDLLRVVVDDRERVGRHPLVRRRRPPRR